jgi:hypothetical protein
MTPLPQDNEVEQPTTGGADVEQDSYGSRFENSSNAIPPITRAERYSDMLAGEADANPVRRQGSRATRSAVRQAAAERFDPDDFVTLRNVSPSLLQRAEVLNASGITIGHVSRVLVGQRGTTRAIRMTRTDGRSVQIDQISLRYNARDRSLLTNLAAAKLERLASTRD